MGRPPLLEPTPREEALPERVTRTSEGFEVLQAEGASVLVPAPASGP